MTDLRKVADTLEMTIPYLPAKTATLSEVEETIEELRQALAQPEQEPICAHGVCKTKCDFCKQPEQEPVGTYGQVAERMYELMRGTVQQMEVYDHFKNILLYTAPPKREWVDLDEEEQKECWDEGGSQWAIYQNIASKLKEKNT